MTFRFFPHTTLNRIQKATDIVEIISSDLPLRKHGENWICLCPFHKEKSPSFIVNPHRQIYYCFGCHKVGDVFTWVMEYGKLDFPEAVVKLAKLANIQL